MDAKKILNDIAVFYGCRGITGLADKTGINQNRVYAWVSRNHIADPQLLLQKCPEINPEYVLTGEGPIAKNSSNDVQQDAEKSEDDLQGEIVQLRAEVKLLRGRVSKEQKTSDALKKALLQLLKAETEHPYGGPDPPDGNGYDPTLLGHYGK